MVKEKSSALVCYVNGVKIVDDNVDPEWTLLQYLRNQLKLCGTKLGCAEGGCGACTVMVSKYDHQNKKIINHAVNACLTPICSVHGCAVITVEGIGSVSKGLHPVQERIAKAHGSQCGFCTPGIVMSMYTLIRNNPNPTMEDIEVYFQGNLCRCTGYRPILEGYKTFTSKNGCGVENCCRLTNGSSSCKPNGSSTNGSDNNFSNDTENSQLFSTNEFIPLEKNTELIFPSELQISEEYNEQYLVFYGKRVTWYRPVTMTQLLELKLKYPFAKIVVGNTEVGVEVKFKNQVYPVIINPSQVKELNEIKYEKHGIRFGASVTLSKLEEILNLEINKEGEYKTRVYASIVDMLHWFAGKQIRNVAAIGGNIITGSPISDLNPIFMAAKCELELRSTDGTRFVSMDDTFFKGYRKNILTPEEILASIFIPYTEENEYLWSFKQAKRRDDDIAIVNASMFVKFEIGTNTIKDIRLAYGGMAPTTVLAKTTCTTLKGLQWNEDIVKVASKTLIEDLPLDPSAPGGMIQFRRSLTLSFFFKFYMIVHERLCEKISYIKPLPNSYKSAIQPFQRNEPTSFQLSQIVPPDQPDYDLVGRPIPHKSAFKQATGEAVYIDDMPKFQDELYLTLIPSTKPYARIISIDPSQALQQEGVIKFISAQDLSEEENRYRVTILDDEEVFARDVVTCVGQSIGAIVGKDQGSCQRGAKLVKVKYEELSPVIITIEDAIKHKSYYELNSWLGCGDVEKGLEQADHVLDGELRMGGQEHFYLETHAAIALPKLEDGEIEIFASSQNPSEIQTIAAKCLGVSQNKVSVRVKRLGGGFGGKETRSNLVAIPCAIVANKLGKPVRCMLDRDEDMAISGGRHPFLCRYKVGCKANGKITALKAEVYNNAGHTIDLSGSVLDRALFQIDNGYKLENVQLKGFCCKTNLPSNTAFRGFGGPQGSFFSENIVNHIAIKLNLDPIKVREINMYKEGEMTHYQQPLTNCTVRRCWDECMESSKFLERKAQVDKFNEENTFKKRGIAIVPNKFNIAFTASFLNQAGSLVHVYKDGSVLLSHGGTEMGQGLHTKMIQVASRVLKIPGEKIHIMETGTDKVPNTSPTAASASSDLNGMAVMNACNKIMETIEPIMKENPKGTWEDWISNAYFNQKSLTATGFYRTPGLTYSPQTKKGDAFNYFCYGAAAAEVEIDCLTGDHNVRRVDIVMDVGESLNPAIDIGQIEGAYMQGYGLLTLEELHYTPNGALLTKGPGMYKLPGFGDIPEQFNVSLLRGAPNPKAVFSSKAVGEPPLFLAASVFFAIKNAISNFKRSKGDTEYFKLDSPATAERIRLACSDEFTEKFKMPGKGTYKPWAVQP